MKFYIETFGCTANQGNSQDLARALQENGHIPSTLEDADAVIVNTCIVTEKTERKVVRRLGMLQGERLIVAGCLSVAIPESISHISCRGRMGLLSGPAAAEIADLFPGPTGPAVAREAMNFQFASDACAVVNISEGCNGSCSYCIVRKARGTLRSRSSEEVEAQVKELVGQGYVELQISAQDTAAYGSDLGTNLAKLLERVAEVSGNFRVRVGMMNPSNILSQEKELIRAFHSPKIYRFLHIPVQSGSDAVLQSMGRKYNAHDFQSAVEAFRSEFPDITIITDIIAGFPGETDEHFQESLQLIDRLQPDKVNITRFSKRPGTPAALKYDMPDRIKKDRSRSMTRMWLDIARERNRRYVGQTISVLVTEQGREGTMKARAENYLGVLVAGKAVLGERVTVEVVDSNSFYVLGRAVH